jgi:hypothetical protein
MWAMTVSLDCVSYDSMKWRLSRGLILPALKRARTIDKLINFSPRIPSHHHLRQVSALFEIPVVFSLL